MDTKVWLEGAKKRFNFDAWPLSEEILKLQIRDLSLDVKQMAETWNLERHLPYGNKGYVDYYKSAENKKHRIMVSISEYLSSQDAYLALLKEISFSSARTLPRLDQLGIDIGDVGFTGYGNIYVSIIFVRHNVLADVRSIGDESFSVIEFAKEIDNKIKNLASL
ncbi:hypothetical protein ACSAZL_05010 [Methanosarcina sp. T3]|uniref:hypothetical protein n=1 Tax=Methanosarcina sp. T3 TaxID=3439062 RepID=UPI003F858151